MKQDIKQLGVLLRKKYDLLMTDEELLNILEYYSDFIADLVAEDSI